MFHSLYFTTNISLQPMLDHGIIELLVSFTKREDLSIRLNGIWALMVSTLIRNAR